MRPRSMGSCLIFALIGCCNRAHNCAVKELTELECGHAPTCVQSMATVMLSLPSAMPNQMKSVDVACALASKIKEVATRPYMSSDSNFIEG